MKMTILPDELSAGSKTMRLSKKRLERLSPAANHHEPILLGAAYRQNSHATYLIVPTGLGAKPDGQWELNFTPLWMRTYAVFHMRSTKLRMLVCEFEDGSKWEIDDAGIRDCSHRTSGAGVGREAEEDAERLAAELITKEQRKNPASGEDADKPCPIVRRMIQLISDRAR